MATYIDISRDENEARRSEDTVERAVNTMLDEGAARAAIRQGGSPSVPAPMKNAEGEPFFLFGEALVDEDGNGRALAPG